MLLFLLVFTVRSVDFFPRIFRFIWQRRIPIIWDHKSVLDSPKKRTLCWGYIYMTQWPNDVMIRHGATCMAAIFDLAYWIAISESCAEMHRLDNQNETSAFKTARTGIVCKKVNNYDNLHGSFFWNFQRCSSITFYAAYTRWRGSISNHIYYKIICLPDRNT